LDAIRQPGGGTKAERKETGNAGEIQIAGGISVCVAPDEYVSVGGYAVGRKGVLVSVGVESGAGLPSGEEDAPPGSAPAHAERSIPRSKPAQIPCVDFRIL
jgi:hypothetical protein